MALRIQGVGAVRAGGDVLDHEGAGARIGAGHGSGVDEAAAAVSFLAVDQFVQVAQDVLAGHMSVHLAPPIPYSAATSASAERRFLRARFSRLMTVPMGTPSSSAISL